MKNYGKPTSLISLTIGISDVKIAGINLLVIQGLSESFLNRLHTTDNADMKWLENSNGVIGDIGVVRVDIQTE